MKKRGKAKKVLAAVMTAVLAFTAVPLVTNPITAKAADDNKTIACVGTPSIKKPVAPGDVNTAWTGSYVWYGAYNGNSVRYRVLAPSTTAYGGTTMLLDCDKILYKTRFDEDSYANPGATAGNEWQYSDIKTGLNGDKFYNSANGFTSLEKKAITGSKIGTHTTTIGSPMNQMFTTYTALTGEKIFVLDFEDVLNTSYGYAADCGYNASYVSHTVNNHLKRDNSGTAIWWLRSPNAVSSGQTAGAVGAGGFISAVRTDATAYGVSPAFNVNLSSVVFSSVVSGTAGANNAEYKLTLADSNMAIALQSGKSVTASGTTITVPYAVSGSNAANATQASILILDKEYKEGNTNGASVKYYGKLSGTFSTKGTGTFQLPSGLSLSGWGSSYQVYLLAEDVNGTKQTDYASAPVKLSAPSGQPAPEEKTVMTITLKNVDSGVKISWAVFAKADKYRVFKKNVSGSWEKLETVTDLSYIDTSVKAGEKATYTVLAMNAAGSALTEYGTGTSITFIAPAMTATVKYKATGAAVSWKESEGAAKYRVFRKTGSGDWTNLATSAGLSYVDKTAVYGKTYIYMVRAMTESGSFITAEGTGTSFTYLAPAPTITAKNAKKGVVLKWTAMTNAVKYRIYVKNSSGAWTKLVTVKDGVTYTDETAKDGKKYTYSVIGMDSAGRLMNDYGTGVTIKREQPKPVMSITLKSVAAGVKVSWSAYKGAGKYRVYRKNSDGTWTALGTVKVEDNVLFFRDKTAVSGKTYTYTVVAMTSGGSALTDQGNGTSIKYQKPVSEAEVVEATVADANGNTVVIIADGDEISMDIIEVNPEDAEKVVEETAEEETEKSSEEETDAKEEASDEVSEDTEDNQDAEAVETEESDEESDKDVIAEENAADTEKRADVAVPEGEEIEESEDISGDIGEEVTEETVDVIPE